MSSHGGAASSSPELPSVAVAVNGGDGRRCKGSKRAVRWAVENLMPQAQPHQLLLVHVVPKITSIPTPSGKCIPIEDLNDGVVALYMQDMRAMLEEIFIPFKKLCKNINVKTLILDDDRPAIALLRYISESGIKSLVLGSFSQSCIMRRIKGPGVPSSVLKNAPNICNIYIVYRHRLVTKQSSSLPTSETGYKHQMLPQSRSMEGPNGSNKQTFQHYASSMESKVHGNFVSSSVSVISYPSSQALSNVASSRNASLESIPETHTFTRRSSSFDSTNTEQLDVRAEVEQLRLELRKTVAMYNQACDDLVHFQNKVRSASYECIEESRKVNASVEREGNLRKLAAEEKAKHLEVMKEVEVAKNFLGEEAKENKTPELKYVSESPEKKGTVEAFSLSGRRYRTYTMEELEIATDFFSEKRVIGEGGYGKVYRCSLDHTPVAVKALRHDASEKKEEFFREVELLSNLRHPHMVLLLGACPEHGCLVYEYMENGSLDDHIYHRKGKSPLPWVLRFKIIFEVACGLAFLHSSKPDPIVHRDLKPGNILLDRNFVSKIGDVGLAKLLPNAAPDNITEYRESIIAGTLNYLDPEYQRTGTVRPKSDIYAFGVIILQLLASCHPSGLVLKVENAIKNGSLAALLDASVMDWPLAETKELAQIALRCSSLRCRDRPDLETEVLPVLKRLNDIAVASIRVDRNDAYAPSHYFCPILQEVMDDPHIAADGFTYEHRAIKAWLKIHQLSPVTKQRLAHTTLTPNHTLSSAIKEWKSRVPML